MSKRTGAVAVVRESATYAAVDTWYDCEPIRMHAGADTIRLYLGCDDDDCGAVKFRIVISYDGTDFDLHSHVVEGPVVLNSGDRLIYTISCAHIVTSDDVTIQFSCSKGAASAKLRIEAMGYQNGSNQNCPSDFLFEVALGRIPGRAVYRKFGHSGSLTAGTVTDVWDYSATQPVYTFSATADIDSISSSNAADTQSIVIEGLDANGDLVEQTATLAGQSRVALATPLWRVFRGYNNNGTDTAGDVYVYPNTTISGGVPVDTTKVRLFISQAHQQTMTTIYTVPRGKKALIYNVSASTSNKTSASAACEAVARKYGMTFRTQLSWALTTTGTSHYLEEYAVPLPFPELTDFKITADSSANNLEVAANYLFVLVNA